MDTIANLHPRTESSRATEAVLLSPDDLEALEETLDLLSTTGALEEIQAARGELERGEHTMAEALRARYLGR